VRAVVASPVATAVLVVALAWLVRRRMRLIVIASLVIVRCGGHIAVFRLLLLLGLLLSIVSLMPFVAIASEPCVKPAEVSHEMSVRHVSELGVVLEGLLDALALHRAHAHILHLPVLKQLAVMPVLELNNLVHVRRGWRRSTLLLHAHLLLLGGVPGGRAAPAVLARLKLGLLPLLVALPVVVRDLEDFLQAFRRLHQGVLP